MLTIPTILNYTIQAIAFETSVKADMGLSSAGRASAYKQRVTGSSPVGPIQLNNMAE